jgi:lipopolysaccharide/colanic/teichoic acid biosynthesis glycosyltransferase
MKRLFDVAAAALGLLVCSPLLLLVLLVLLLLLPVWWQDRHSPFYLAPRVGKDGGTFRMVKLRSMIVNADATGVDSTSIDDKRITPLGRYIRRFKLDELPQLWNVLRGDMSLVGPRPNVRRETDLYTPLERRLLDVRPGVTDFASIVFSDLGEILKAQEDPDIAYNQLVRPGKSMLGVFYVDHLSVWVDLQLCWLTAVAIVSRPRALAGVRRLLQRLGAPQELLRIASRAAPLIPMSPPGADQIVTVRNRSPAR